MDLNEVPSDIIVVEPELELNNVLRNVSNGVVEEQCLDLRIRNKEAELEEIRAKIRVLQGEKAGIEEVISGLRKKKASLEGTKIRVLEGEWAGIEEVISGLRKKKASLEGAEIGESNVDKETKIDELMTENKVLECEKIALVKEVEDWKRKCTEFEVRVCEMEKRLICKDDKGGNVNVGGESNLGSETSSPDVVDSELRIRGKRVMKQLSFCHERNSNPKIAPSSPVGASPASVAVVDSDSDPEPDIHALLEVEENDLPVNIPKRKRDLRVITNDDEIEETDVLPKRRAFKIENSDSESEDDGRTIKVIFDRVENKSKSKSNQSDDEDNIPISQLKLKHGHCSKKHPRRRLIKCGQSQQTCRTRGIRNSRKSLTKKYVEDEKSEEDDSESDDDLSDFVVDDDYDANDLEDESSEDSDQPSHESKEASDDELNFEDIISGLGRRKDPNSEWVLQGDMLSDFGKNPGLCMRAVCAINRRQIDQARRLQDEGIYEAGRGFSKYDECRGSILADFLTDGNPEGDVVKSVAELEGFDPSGPATCRDLASRYSNNSLRFTVTRKIHSSPNDLFLLEMVAFCTECKLM